MARTSTNTPLLKLITPDHLRLGRISNRVPVGPFQLPNSPRDMIARAEELYWRWHEVFNDTMLPVLMAADQPKWYNHDADLKEGDVVYFRKTTGAIRSPWSMGIVDAVTIGRDNLIRNVSVRYYNASEPDTPHTTDRAVRSLVRLFNVDETSWAHDLDRIRSVCKATNLRIANDSLTPSDIPPTPSLSCGCCCTHHHELKPDPEMPMDPFPEDGPLTPRPAPDVMVHHETDDLPDVLLDAGARDDLTHHPDSFATHVITLGALPMMAGQLPL